MRRSLFAVSACIFANAPWTLAAAQDAGASASATAVPAVAAAARPLLVDRVGTDPADIVRARVGQTFAIALHANRSSGFAWQLAQPTAPSVGMVGSAYETRTLGSSGGDQELWLFRALSAGDAQLTLRYVRPSEKGSPLMERALTFHVEIDP